MKPLKIGGLASEEFRGAVRWYEGRRTGWGAKLFDAIVHTTDLIVAHPEIGEVRKGRFPSRQLRVLGFPYYVAYRVREADIYVIAIAHTTDDPAIGASEADTSLPHVSIASVFICTKSHRFPYRSLNTATVP